MDLRQLIERLQATDPNKRVPAGFNRPHSYRGYYDQLAFEPCGPTTVGEMLAAARGAVGATFQGYKGGDFTMQDYTSVWLAERGCSGGEPLTAAALDVMLGETAADRELAAVRLKVAAVVATLAGEWAGADFLNCMNTLRDIAREGRA